VAQFSVGANTGNLITALSNDLPLKEIVDPIVPFPRGPATYQLDRQIMLMFSLAVDSVVR
jgi:hypothetical protein